MKRRTLISYWATLVFIAVLSLGLVGCGGSGPSGDGTVNGRAAVPTFSPAPVDNTWASVQVTMASRTSGALIKYTTDGSDPKTSSSAEAFASWRPINVDRTMTIKAYAYKTGVGDSDVSTATYTRTVADKAVVLLSNGQPYEAEEGFEISLYNSDGTGWEAKTNFITSDPLNGRMSISSAGKLLFFSAESPINNTTSSWQYYLMDVTAPASVNVVTGLQSNDSDAFISASGEIVFMRDVNQSSSAIWTMSSDGNIQKFADAAGYYCPTISSDGTKVVTQYYSDHKPRGLYLFTPGTTNPQLLVELTTSEAGYSVISPDGTKVAYVADDGNVYTMNTDGNGTPLKLTNWHYGTTREPAWSSDGTKIAYVLHFSLSVDDKFGVYIMNSDGTQNYLFREVQTNDPSASRFKYPVLR